MITNTKKIGPTNGIVTSGEKIPIIWTMRTRLAPMRKRKDPNEESANIPPRKKVSRILQFPVGPSEENEQFPVVIVGHGPVIWFMVF